MVRTGGLEVREEGASPKGKQMMYILNFNLFDHHSETLIVSRDDDYLLKHFQLETCPYTSKQDLMVNQQATVRSLITSVWY